MKAVTKATWHCNAYGVASFRRNSNKTDSGNGFCVDIRTAGAWAGTNTE